METNVVYHTKEIATLLPQAGPAQMLDKILFEPSTPTLIVGVKRILPNDPWLVGHFPGKPIFPGHCTMECCFLTALALVKISLPDLKETPLIIGVEKLEFRTSVQVGDTLQFETKLIENHRNKKFLFDVIVRNQDFKVIAKIFGIKGLHSMKK